MTTPPPVYLRKCQKCHAEFINPKESRRHVIENPGHATRGAWAKVVDGGVIVTDIKKVRSGGIVYEVIGSEDIKRGVYFFLRSDGRIKIGVSNNIRQRKKDLESAAGPLVLLTTMEGSRMVEQALHLKFSASRVHGEWFDPSVELLALIHRLQTDGVQYV